MFFVTGIILTLFFNYDPIFIFTTAIIIQLFYFKSVPSGASFFPEYSLSFFITTGSAAYILGLRRDNIIDISEHLFNNNLYLYIVISIIIIITSSYFITRLYSLKNRFLEDEIKIFGNKNIKIAIYSSFITILIGIVSSTVILITIMFIISISSRN